MNKNGFTLVEVLISLAISAILLAAVAAVFNASVINYGENEDMFWAINNARQAMARMTAQLRTGHTVNPTADANECSFYTSAGQDITYQYRSAQQKLYLIVHNSSGFNDEYTLCDNVVAASFAKTPTDDGTDCKSVQISLTVQSDNVRRTLSAAAVIRRNLGS